MKAGQHHPVLHYLAVVRAARDFGLAPERLERLTRDFRPERESVDQLADRLASVLLEQR